MDFLSTIGTSAIISAVERDDVARLRQLLLPEQTPGPGGRSAGDGKNQMAEYYGPLQLARCLYIAAARGSLQCARVLIEAGAQPNIRSDTNGNTPLIIATRGGDVDLVKLLISAGCDVNIASKVARSRAIHWAASSPEDCGSLECLQLLLEAGADVEARVASGRTTLMLASRAGHFKVVQELLEHGAKVNSADNDRVTSLHLAAQEGCLDCARHLIKCGADLNALTRHGDTALCLAARHGHDNIVALLLDAASSPAANTRRRWRPSSSLTPLHWAADGGHVDCVRLLLGQPTWAECADRPTTDRVEIGEFAAPRGITPLALAARAGCSDVIRLLTSPEHVPTGGIDVDRQDDDGMTALLYAVQTDHYSCVEQLVLAGANPDGVTINHDESPHASTSGSDAAVPMTPLMLALSGGCVTSLKVLLKAGCRLDQRGRASHYENPVLPMEFLVGEVGLAAGKMRRLVEIALAADGSGWRSTAATIYGDAFKTEDEAKSTTLDNRQMALQQSTNLAQICRACIRNQLRSVGRCGGVLKNVPLLPLPSSLQRFLLLEELDAE